MIRFWNIQLTGAPPLLSWSFGIGRSRTVDSQTIFVIAETNEAEKEVWLFRMTEYKGV